jgi:hypothetical protein
MSRATRKRWTGRTGCKAGGALYVCVALLLVLQIVYTPIHLHQVPHSDEMDFGAAAPLASAAAFLDNEHQDGDGHHGRHPAAQHKFKVVSPERLVMGQMELMPALEWTEPAGDQQQPHLFGFSGLSPPELSVSWRFIFRAALSVRAPTFLS